MSYPEYDRQGRVRKIIDASGTRELSYEDGQLTDENYTADTLLNYKIDRTQDALSRLESLILKRETDELYRTNYGYDAASRLQTVTYGNHTNPALAVF